MRLPWLLHGPFVNQASANATMMDVPANDPQTGSQAMSQTPPDQPIPAPARKARTRLQHLAAVLLGALFLSWPAFYNGFPLLYPDSMTYLGDGRIVARAVFLHQFSPYYGVRSFFYSLGILPFHWNISPWPIAFLQSVLVAWVLWLVVRSIAPRQTHLRYLAVVLVLSLLTGVSWFSVFVMPDILGPLAYLALYLLVFAPETLSRAERFSLYPIAVWGITAHATHLVLAAGLILLLAMYAALERRRFLSRIKSVEKTAAILAVAAAAQLALHGYLYGKPTLNGERPPYLMARIIADGPGRQYLETHCAQAQWAICNRMPLHSDDPDDFLWGDDGAYAGASNGERGLIAQQEMPFVKAVLRAYPREQLLKSAANFRDQLNAFGIYGFDPNSWLLDQFNTVLPLARSSFAASRQQRSLLPLDEFTAIQFCTVVVSLGIVAVSIPFLWRWPNPKLAGLSVIVVAIVVANAFVTGVLSMVDDRYGYRVIWLIPLLAALFLLDWLNRWETGKEIRARTNQERPD
jgi:hypothetical protein